MFLVTISDLGDTVTTGKAFESFTTVTVEGRLCLLMKFVTVTLKTYSPGETEAGMVMDPLVKLSEELKRETGNGRVVNVD